MQGFKKPVLGLPEPLAELFKNFLGVHTVQPLLGDGSQRQLFRAKNATTTVVGVWGADPKENAQFVRLSKTFKKAGLAVPEIYLTHKNQLAYLVQDLGDVNLAQQISHWQKKQQAENILKAYQEVLPLLNQLFKVNCAGLQSMDKTHFTSQIDYFDQELLQPFSSNPISAKVYTELEQLLTALLVHPPAGTVSFDFNSRNIMWHKNKPVLIDYQDALYGTPYFDLASMLYSGCSGLNAKQRQQLMQEYHALSGEKLGYAKFNAYLYDFVLLRRLRSLGSYSFLAYKQKKLSFLQYIQKSIDELLGLAKTVPSYHKYPALWAALKNVKLPETH